MPLANGNGTGKRVLLVEDHAAFREAFASLLESNPNIETVLQAESVSEGRKAGANNKLDVAVVDSFLPDGDGVDLIGDLREVTPHLPVLMLTVCMDPEQHARALEAGAKKVLTKATDFSDVATWIAKLAD